MNIESPQAPARLATRPLSRRGYWIRVAAGGVAYSRRPLVRETRSSPITAWNGNGTPTGMPWNRTKEDLLSTCQLSNCSGLCQATTE